jgi:tetratricopeptide (TPR) repeat protein
MLIYDTRIDYFDEEGYVLGRKGIDILRFNEKEFDKAYEAFSRSANIAREETDLNVLIGLVQTSAAMLKVKKIEPLIFLTDYLSAINIITEKSVNDKEPGKTDNVRTVIDNILMNSGLRDCKTIEEIFSSGSNEMNNDIHLLKIAEKLLSSSGCTNTSFYADLSTKLLEVSPDPRMAYEVAKFNIRDENFEKAAEYLQKAIDSEENMKQKAVYHYQLAVILSSKLNNYQEAMTMARMAVDHDPSFGEPYLLMASNFISGVKECTSDLFERAAIYWLATDFCIKAKQADPSLESKANENIAFYKQNYPSKEETFFRSLKQGDPYSFGCWINESTFVKEK